MGNHSHTFSRRLFQRARCYLVGGVNSPVRRFSYVGGRPLLLKRGHGAFVFDYDDKAYIDYVLSWGALILGHAPEKVLKEVKVAVSQGLSFGATGEREVELAAWITGAIPFAEKVRFVSSGSEAVMTALRLARGKTGREKILKFDGSYHGHADSLLNRAGSGLATMGIPTSAGVPRAFLKTTLVASRNIASVEKIFKRYGRQIAAVLVEPVGGNHGVIAGDPLFLRSLRRITKKYASLLIADEVINGFRFGFGSYLVSLGIVPDLICLGKIIGGGLPIGALAGRSCLMNHLAPSGLVYQASTFAGNPIVMQAGISTLKRLASFKGDYGRIADLTKLLSLRLREEAQRYRVPLKIAHFHSMFSLRFVRKQQFVAFYHRMRKGGIFLAPSEFEANFVSFAHTRGHIHKTTAVAQKAFKAIAS